MAGNKSNYRAKNPGIYNKNHDFWKDNINMRELGYICDLDRRTIDRWYRFWEHDYFKKPEGVMLPESIHISKMRTIKRADIPLIEKFSAQLISTHIGMMAHFNKYESLAVGGFSGLTTWLEEDYVDKRIVAVELFHKDDDTVNDKYVEKRNKLLLDYPMTDEEMRQILFGGRKARSISK